MNALLKKLTQLLESDDLELRIAAMRVTTEIGFNSKPVIQSLGRCLREPHDDLRLSALKALSRLGAKDVAPMVVPLILATGPLREHAMAVISAVGPSVIPQLKILYPEADFHGKRAVVSAMARIGGKPALAFLIKILPEEPFELQKHLALSICEALDRLPPPQQAPIYGMVMRLLRGKSIEKNPQGRVTGAILLGHFRGSALGVKARAELRALADKKHPPEVRRHAYVSFNRLMDEGKFSHADEQFLWKSLSDEDWHNVAQHALGAFQRLDMAKKALPKLVELLHHTPHFSVHIHIFERLQASDRAEVAEAILPFLADGRFRVRESAEAALRKMPTSIESLFALLMKTDDLEVTQRINAILRDFPQETRQKYVERASARLLALFEDNDLHYKSFLEFVKSLDPEPLRKRVYEKAQSLKKSKSRDKWEAMASVLQILWDNHLITAEGRYLMAVALIKSSPKDLAPAARRANLGLRVIRALIYDNYDDLVKRLVHDKDLDGDDYFYLGFHFSEEGEEMRPFATAMLEHVVKKYPKAKVAGPATHKLHLQQKAFEAAQEAARLAAEEAHKKELRKLKKAGRLLAVGAAPGVGSPPVPAGKSPVPTGKSPVPTGKSPVPTGKLPVPTGKSPVPAGKSPVPAGKLPAPVGKSPAPAAKLVVVGKAAAGKASPAPIPSPAKVASQVVVGKAMPAPEPLPTKKPSSPKKVPSGHSPRVKGARSSPKLAKKR